MIPDENLKDIVTNKQQTGVLMSVLAEEILTLRKQNAEYIEALREQKELLTKILIHLEVRELEKGLQFDIKQTLNK